MHRGGIANHYHDPQYSRYPYFSVIWWNRKTQVDMAILVFGRVGFQSGVAQLYSK